MLMLAQNTTQPTTVEDNVYWIYVICLALLAALILLYVVYRVARKRYIQGQNQPQGPWTLQDLRELQEQGQISVEEYNRLRQAIIREVKGDKGGVDRLKWDDEEYTVVWRADVPDNNGPDGQDSGDDRQDLPD